MKKEIDAQITNDTWVFLPLLEGHTSITCKWVFSVKFLSTGTLDKYNAHLVAKGFLQEFGVDYSKTFSPVIKNTTIRVVLTLVLPKGWKV